MPRCGIIAQNGYIMTGIRIKGGVSMANTAALKDKAIDPVCGMTVEPIRAELVATHAGCRYYFCAEACRRAFETDPGKYLNPKNPVRKGWWRRYLGRLEKATGGKSMSCH